MSTKQCEVMQLADDDKLNQTLFLWFVQNHSQSLPVSGTLLYEKAMDNA